jgi:2'-hydroxyisoflavone reductase
MINPAARPTTEWFEGLSRREALRMGLLAGGVAALGAQALAQTPASPASAPAPGAEPGVPKADKPLQVLVLGGTIFLGPPTVERLLARGHSVTLFNRGKSNPQLFPNLEKLRGNRTGDLASLHRPRWTRGAPGTR